MSRQPRDIVVGGFTFGLCAMLAAVNWGTVQGSLFAVCAIAALWYAVWRITARRYLEALDAADEWAARTTNVAGVALIDVHDPADCEGRGCVIHHPSEHHMRGWPLAWRDPAPTRYMERTCPHGVGHPDPDDAAYHRQRGHPVVCDGCDGCCQQPAEVAANE